MTNNMSTIDLPEQEVLQILQLSESHFVDFKSKEISPSKCSKTISAFANSAGGEIYIGIEEIVGDDGHKRVWNGFKNQEDANGLIQTVESLSPLGNHYILNFLSSQNFSGIVVQLTVIKTQNILSATDGKIYVRKGAQSLPLIGEVALNRLKLDKGIISFEDEIINNVDISEVSNSNTVIEFMLDTVPTGEPETWLRKQHLIKSNHLTVAGILLFADEPQAILPKRSAVKIYQYKTRGEGERDTLVGEPSTIEGCLYDLIYDAVAKCKEIVESIKKLTTLGMQQIDYPEEALHEILTNAVLHRDYSIAADVHVRIYDNRLEIENPGKLPGHITIKNILNEQYARNAKIIRLINKFPEPPNKDVGEGLNTAFEAMEKIRLKPPLIEEKENSILVTLRHESLASPEIQVMAYLEKNLLIKNSIARDITGIKSENVMKNVFYRLRDNGLIRQVPGSKSKWEKILSVEKNLVD